MPVLMMARPAPNCCATLRAPTLVTQKLKIKIQRSVSQFVTACAIIAPSKNGGSAMMTAIMRSKWRVTARSGAQKKPPAFFKAGGRQTHTE